jgi:hypothetical protein
MPYPTITSDRFPAGNWLAFSRLPGKLRELQERFTAKLSGNFSENVLEFSNKCSKLPGAVNPSIIFSEIKIRKIYGENK